MAEFWGTGENFFWDSGRASRYVQVSCFGKTVTILYSDLISESPAEALLLTVGLVISGNYLGPCLC